MAMMYPRPLTCSSVCHPCGFIGALPTVYTTVAGLADRVIKGSALISAIARSADGA